MVELAAASKQNLSKKSQNGSLALRYQVLVPTEDIVSVSSSCFFEFFSNVGDTVSRVAVGGTVGAFGGR